MERRHALKTAGQKIKADDCRTIATDPKRPDAELLTPEHRAWRTAVLRMAGHRCEAIEQGRRCTVAAPSRLFADHIVERSLRRAGLWLEVRDRLGRPGSGLSGGQQQRLCIARAIAVEPQVLLMDEPCSALDPISTSVIEDLIHELKELYTIVIVTHNMQQAARVSDITGFFNLAGVGKPGHLIESGRTEKIFSNPDDPATEAYIQGRFG